MGAQPVGLDALNQVPDGFDACRGQDDQVPRRGQAQSMFGGVQLLIDGVDALGIAAGGQRSLGQQTHDVALGPPTIVGRLAEDEVVEIFGADLAHLADLGLAPVAGYADQADAVGPVRLDRRHHPAKGPQGLGIVGVVQDDAEILRLVDIHPAGVLGIGRTEGRQSLGDSFGLDAGAVGHGCGGERILDVEQHMAVHGRRHGPRLADGAGLAPIMERHHAGAGVVENRHAAVGHVLEDEARRFLSAAQREPADPTAGVAGHTDCQGIVGVEDADAAAGDAFDDDGLHRRQVLKSVDALEAEVVGLDIEHGADLLRLQQLLPHSAVAIVSSRADSHSISMARAFGVQGYLPKAAPVETLVNGVGALLRGEELFPADAQTDAAVIDFHKRVARLSAAQLRVLRALSDGKLNKEIAGDMNLTEGTVKQHVSAILKKLEVNNRSQAVLAAAPFMRSL